MTFNMREMTSLILYSRHIYRVGIVNISDYSSFGVELDGRTIENDFYRNSFQGQEKDDEIKGKGNSVNYNYRMHDPRVGRFFVVDPLQAKFPWNSSYAFSENRVVDGVELEGLEYTSANGTFYGAHNSKVGVQVMKAERENSVKREAINAVINTHSSDGSLSSYNRNFAQNMSNLQNASGSPNLAAATEVVGGIQVAVTTRVEGIIELFNPFTMQKRADAIIADGVATGKFANQNNMNPVMASVMKPVVDNANAWKEGGLLHKSEVISGKAIDFSTAAYGGLTSLGKMSSTTVVPKVHGNSLSSKRPTWGYKLYSQDGTFLKNGITSELKAESRYTKKFMSDKYMDAIKFQNRLDAYKWEFNQNKIKKGPLNKNNH